MIKALTWEQIYSFYQQYVQGKPMTIILMGDPKKIDMKRLEAKYGKKNIIKVGKTKLFATLDLDF